MLKKHAGGHGKKQAPSSRGQRKGFRGDSEDTGLQLVCQTTDIKLPRTSTEKENYELKLNSQKFQVLGFERKWEMTVVSGKDGAEVGVEGDLREGLREEERDGREERGRQGRAGKMLTDESKRRWRCLFS